MANALKKITTAAKAYRKKHPKTSWKSAVKKAGSMYRSGKLKPKRKAAVKRKVVRRKPVKRRTVARKKVVRARVPKRRTRKSGGVTVLLERGATPKSRPRRVYRVKRKKTGRYSGVRRVGASKKDNFLKVLAIGGLAVGLIVAFSREKRNDVYVPTGNVNRDSKAQQILQYAQAAGLVASQIAALIAQLNQSSDSQVEQIYQNSQQGLLV